MLTIRAVRIIKGFLRGLLLAAGSAATLIAIVCGLIVVQGQRDEARDSGAAIVLSTAQGSGDPMPVLRARLDHALDLYRRGIVKRIILTGGAGAGAKLSQAAVGKQYLIDQRLPSEALLLDERSTTTWESLNNATDLARANGIDTVLVVSDPAQMLRSLKMARDLGLSAYGSPARTSPLAGNQAEAARSITSETWAYLMYLFTRR